MRSDVKLGVGVGLLIIIAFIGYQVFIAGGGSSDDANSSGENTLASGDGAGDGSSAPGGGLPSFGGRDDGPGVTPLPPVTPPEPSGGVVIPPAPEPSGGVVIPPAPEPSGGVVIPPAPEPSGGVVIPPAPEPSGGTVTPPPIAPVEPPPVEPWRPAVSPPPIAPPSIGPASPTAERTYVVQEGDNGFWAVAAKQYGDGKYYHLIAKANPDVNSSTMKPGDRLVLPPKPTEGTSTATAGGRTITPAPGQKVYTVTKDDKAGFWGIAKKHYGNAMYYRVIAEANPNVNASAMKVGQQLVIPELTDAHRRSIASAPSAPTPARPAPRRTDVEDIGELPRF